MAGASNDIRPRQNAAERARQLVDAADIIVDRDRSADFSMAEIAGVAGVSRALVYAYFQDRYRLLDALMLRHVQWLVASGILEAASKGGLEERACSVSGLYLRHIASHGAAIDIVMRDDQLACQLDGVASRLRRRVFLALARAAVTTLRMTPPEALAFVQLLVVVPEEAARQVRSSVLSLGEAQALNNRMIVAAIAAQVPCG